MNKPSLTKKRNHQTKSNPQKTPRKKNVFHPSTYNQSRRKPIPLLFLEALQVAFPSTKRLRPCFVQKSPPGKSFSFSETMMDQGKMVSDKEIM